MTRIGTRPLSDGATPTTLPQRPPAAHHQPPQH